jgi:L-fuculose-phosphate aldolase
MRVQEVRAEMIKICRWLFERAFVAADAGTVSARISDHKILITPRDQGFGWLTQDQLVLMDLAGQSMDQTQEPSWASGLHLAAYGHREDVRAILHAQPPSATAFAVAGIPLVQPVLAETVLTVGAVPMTSYCTPYTEEAAESIGSLIGSHDALLLKNRGVLTVGRDLMDALQKLERVEQLASVLLAARSLEHVDLLPGAQVKKLMALREQMNLQGKNPWFQRQENKGD